MTKSKTKESESLSSQAVGPQHVELTLRPELPTLYCYHMHCSKQTEIEDPNASMYILSFFNVVMGAKGLPPKGTEVSRVAMPPTQFRKMMDAMARISGYFPTETSAKATDPEEDA